MADRELDVPNPNAKRWHAARVIGNPTVGRTMPDSSSPETAFAAIAAALLPDPDVSAGTGFGTNPGLRSGRKIFAMLVGGELVVKLPAAQCSKLVAAEKGRPFEVGARTMREWVRVVGVDETAWLALAREARTFVAPKSR